MSGFEVAGIVLAVLPLFVEATKGYGTAAWSATKAATRDEKLAEFYELFHYEAWFLRAQLERVVDHLPGIAEERKQEVKQNRELEKYDSQADNDLSAAIEKLFSSPDRHATFQITMGKVLALLGRLILDKTMRLSKADREDQGKMIQKIKEFQKGLDEKSLKSSFWERFRFHKKEKDREACLKNLRGWNKRVSAVVDTVCSRADRGQAPAGGSATPQNLPLIRDLSRKMFSAIWRYWACQCPTAHEVRFSLAGCAICGRNTAQPGLELSFDCLMSRHQPQHSQPSPLRIPPLQVPEIHTSPPQTHAARLVNPPSQFIWNWRGGTVAIKPPSKQRDSSRSRLHKICDVLRDAHNPDQRFQLFVEDLEPAHEIYWQLNWRRPEVQYLRTKSEVSLEMILQTAATPPMIERRRLALILAQSVLQLHESPWISDQWSKQSIFFFSTSDGLDLKRPYLSAATHVVPSGAEPPNRDIHHHGNPGILRLGILLLEVHCWRPIESYYHQDIDLLDGRETSLTELSVARRVLLSETMSQNCLPTYTKAIDVCLYPPWTASGSAISLNNAETQKGIYEDVVLALKREVDVVDACLGQ